jgi:acetyl-CoA C-acetyltransferase
VTPPARTPVLIGWSQVSRFDGEPLQAWAAALRATGVLPAAVDSLDVVYCQSWPYDDPAGRLAEVVGAAPRRAAYSGIGGTTPLSLLGAAARRIAAGQSEVCAVVAGEALATVRRLKKEGRRPEWSHRDPVKRPFPFEAPFHPSEMAHQVFQAYTTFALRDVARRAHLGIGVDDHRRAIGRLFSPMTEVAAANPHAWFPAVRGPDELTQVTPANRVVAHPYTKLVTSCMDVDQAAAFVVASGQAADRLGIPPDRRVHVRGWAEARDPDYVAEHDELWRSPAMAAAFDRALAQAGVGADDVARFDLYSCFPSSVSFSLDALGLAPDDRRAPWTVTGGLPYAGGPGSGYAVGSVAAMAGALVADPGSVGMVTAVGMHLSKHAAVVLSTEPGGRSAPAAGPAPAASPAPATGRAPDDRRPASDGEPVRRPIVESAEGHATVAAYTVHHDREGAATDALLVCDLEGGARCYARSEDPDLMEEMERHEWVGRDVSLRTEGAVNVVVGAD